MESGPLSDEQVASALSDFVCIQVGCPWGEYIEARDRFGFSNTDLQGYGAIVILSPEGQERKRMVGVRSAEELLEAIHEARSD